MTTAPIEILLVEDNPADADLMRETMEASKMHVAITGVRDGLSALQYLRGEAPYEGGKRPDLILLDLNLPKVNGKQVLSAIKNDADLRGIPVVILTSSSAEQDIAASYGLGANCYVVKPVDLKAFQSIVRTVEDFWFTVVKLPQMGEKIAAHRAFS